MGVMGIDQSYRKCGIIILKNNNVIFDSVLSSNTSIDVYQQAVEITNKISDIIYQQSPEYIAMEGLAYASQGNKTRDLGGLMFLIVNMIRNTYFYQYEKNFCIIPPTTIKKFATGNGRNPKKALYEALPVEIKKLFKDTGYTSIEKGREDVTDAYWVARYLQEKNK